MDTNALEAFKNASHALAVWQGTETHVGSDGFPLMGQIEKGNLLADALYRVLPFIER